MTTFRSIASPKAPVSQTVIGWMSTEFRACIGNDNYVNGWWSTARVCPKSNGYLAWLLFMMTSSNGNIFRVTGPLCGEFTGPGGFPAQRPVTRSFDNVFDLCMNKQLNKQSWGWWFETPLCPLRRHRDVESMTWMSKCLSYEHMTVITNPWHHLRKPISGRRSHGSVSHDDVQGY